MLITLLFFAVASLGFYTLYLLADSKAEQNQMNDFVANIPKKHK